MEKDTAEGKFAQLWTVTGTDVLSTDCSDDTPFVCHGLYSSCGFMTSISLLSTKNIPLQLSSCDAVYT